MFLDLSVLCLVLVVAKRFLAPSLQISHKTLMGLRLNSRAGRVLGIYCSFFPPSFAAVLTYLLLLSYADHDLADAAILLPFSSFDPQFSEFLGVLHVKQPGCSSVPLRGAAAFALALQLTLQGLSFTVMFVFSSLSDYTPVKAFILTAAVCM